MRDAREVLIFLHYAVSLQVKKPMIIGAGKV